MENREIDTVEDNHQEELKQQQEYEQRVLVFRLETYPFISFQNNHIKDAFKLFKGTRKEFDQLYNQVIKDHVNESKLPPVEILYTDKSQVDKVDGNIDRNIITGTDNEWRKTCINRQSDYRYLRSRY